MQALFFNKQGVVPIMAPDKTEIPDTEVQDSGYGCL